MKFHTRDMCNYASADPAMHGGGAKGADTKNSLECGNDQCFDV